MPGCNYWFLKPKHPRSLMSLTAGAGTWLPQSGSSSAIPRAGGLVSYDRAGWNFDPDIRSKDASHKPAD
jgi:hypothetical protein